MAHRVVLLLHSSRVSVSIPELDFLAVGRFAMAIWVSSRFYGFFTPPKYMLLVELDLLKLSLVVKECV